MNTLKAVFSNPRVKSFFWRLGMMVLATIIGYFASNVNLLAPYISPASIGVIGLVLGEISKAISDKLASQN